MNKKVSSLFIIFVLLFFILLQGIPFSLEVSADENMDYVNRMIQEIFLREGYQRKKGGGGISPIKCATPIIRYALTHKELLWPENNFILYRPTDTSGSEDDRYYKNVIVLTYNSPGGHFRIHYTEDNRYGDAVYGSDGNLQTIPPYVHYLASYFDYVWFRETDSTQMHFLTPQLDNTIGGDFNKVDVYLLDISAYGYTAVDKDEFLYICMQKDFWHENSNGEFDPNGVQAEDMKVTAAHEFFHTIQFEYDDWYDYSPMSYQSNIWWEESTAVWIEDEVYDEVDDYLRYLPSRFQYPDRPLDYSTSSPGYFEYGGVIFAKFLAEETGHQEIIRKTFERCKQIMPYSPPLAKDAIGDVLINYTLNWGEAMKRFSIKNLKRDYLEGESYPVVSFTKTVTPEEIETGYSSSQLPLNHLSCHYIRLLSDSHERDIYITVTPSANAINPIVILLADRFREGKPSRDLIEINPYYPLYYHLGEFGAYSAYPLAYLLIINPDPNPSLDSVSSYSFTVHYNPPPYTSSSPVVETILYSDGGGGCFISSLSRNPFFCYHSTIGD